MKWESPACFCSLLILSSRCTISILQWILLGPPNCPSQWVRQILAHAGRSRHAVMHSAYSIASSMPGVLFKRHMILWMISMFFSFTTMCLSEISAITLQLLMLLPCHGRILLIGLFTYCIFTYTSWITSASSIIWFSCYLSKRWLASLFFFFSFLFTK